MEVKISQCIQICTLEEPDITNPAVLTAEINNLMQIIGRACFCSNYTDEENAEFYKQMVEEARFKLINIINKLKVIRGNKGTMKPKSELEEELFQLNFQINSEEEKLKNLRHEWRKQQHQLADLQEQLFKNRRLLTLQTSKACTQGAALAGALYPVLSQPNILENFLKDDDFLAYIKIFTGTLSSFASAHAKHMPLNDSPDYKFILYLCRGIIITSMHIPGRKYLLKDEYGQNMIKELIKVLPVVRYPKAESLKIAMLEILKNFSQDFEGGGFLYTCEDLLISLADCINKDHNTVIYRLALTVLASQTRLIDKREYLEMLVYLINMDRFYELTESKDRHIKQLSKNILRDITIIADRLGIHVPKPTPKKISAGTSFACLCRQVQKSTSKMATTAKTVITKSKVSTVTSATRSSARRSKTKVSSRGDIVPQVKTCKSKSLETHAIEKQNKSCTCVETPSKPRSPSILKGTSSRSQQNTSKRSISFADLGQTGVCSKTPEAKKNPSRLECACEVDESNLQKAVLQECACGPDASASLKASSTSNTKKSEECICDANRSGTAVAQCTPSKKNISESLSRTSNQSQLLKGAKIVSVKTLPNVATGKCLKTHSVLTKIQLAENKKLERTKEN